MAHLLCSCGLWAKDYSDRELRYIHGNPVRRGLVKNSEDWQCRSYRHYLTGEVGVVEIESQGRRGRGNVWVVGQ
jgi:hypothetical protein